MQQLNFSDLRGGKLFCDQFDDVRLGDREKFIAGNSFEITVKGQVMGIAKILTVYSFPFIKLNDAVSMRTYGKGANYMAAILKRFYDCPKNPIRPDTKMDQIVFQYTYREIENQRILLQDWWKHKEEQQPVYTGQTKMEF
jgi:hypothetical protein